MARGKGNTFTTPKGTVLPLTNLKGKDYLMVAYRLVWLTEEYASYTIDTEYLALTEEFAVCRAKINLYDENGKLIKTATATKRETKADFSDFTEKCETGAVGRALAMLGLGTQFCTQELDEGMRLADSPITPAKKTTKKTTSGRSSFNKNVKVEVPAEPVEAASGWE